MLPAARLRVLKMLLAGSLLLFVLYQIDKNSRIDDNVIGENLYFLLTEGRVRSELMRGYGNLSLHTGQTIFHKLFLYLAYPFVALTGWSLPALHLFSLLCFAVLALALWRGFRYLVPDFRLQDRLLFGCLLLINYNILYFSGTFRPEVLLTLLGFLQFIALRKFLWKEGAFWLPIAAVLGGSGLATHPHGAIFLVAGGVLLLAYRHWRGFLLYAALSGVCFAGIYFADILLHQQLAIFLHQATHDPIIGGQRKHWYTPLLGLAEEHTRLFFNEREIVTTLLLAAALALGWKQLRNGFRISSANQG